MKKSEVAKAGLYSNVLMVLTSIHHIYGAIIYNTTWRLHAIVLSILVLAITIVLGRWLAGRNFSNKNFFFWLYWVVILVASVLGIGAFEGVYNHLLKDVLFYSGVNPEVLL